MTHPPHTIGDEFPELLSLQGPRAVSELLEYPYSPDDRIAAFRLAAIYGSLASDRLNSVDAVAQCGESLLRRIDSAASRSYLHETLSFCVATVTAERLQIRGESIGTAAFLQRAIAAAGPSGTWDVRPGRLRLWHPYEGDALSCLQLEMATRYFVVLFGHAWDHPDYDEFADQMWVNFKPTLTQCLAVTPPESLDPDAAVIWAASADLHRAQWALRSGLREPYGHIESIWLPVAAESGTDPMLRKALISFFASLPRAVGGVAPSEWAELLLQVYRGEISAPVRLRALVAACDGQPDELMSRLFEIREAAREHRERQPEGEGPVVQLYGRSQSSMVLSWPLRALLECGRSTEAVGLLRDWMPREPRGAAIGMPLFMLPTSISGTAWSCAPQLTLAMDKPPSDTLATLSSAIDVTFNGSFDLRSDQPWDQAATRTGAPDIGNSATFESAVRAHLNLDELAPSFHRIPDGAAIVPWPMLRVPVQALMAEKFGRVLPISASLCASLEVPALTRVVLLGSGSMTSELERDAVRANFEHAGVAVEVLAEASAQDFREVYLRSDVDVIWLCSHGQFDHVRPHRSAIIVNENEGLDLLELEELQAEAPQRSRLLVLNVCDAGGAPNVQGMYAMGVAPVLASREQSVISHLWPINSLAGAVFGGMLSMHLSRGASHASAFGRALGDMRGGQASIVDRLNGCGMKELGSRVARNSIDWESIVHWGSPILVS